jgi:hypothetical protein
MVRRLLTVRFSVEVMLRRSAGDYARYMTDSKSTGVETVSAMGSLSCITGKSMRRCYPSQQGCADVR